MLVKVRKKDKASKDEKQMQTDKLLYSTWFLFHQKAWRDCHSLGKYTHLATWYISGQEGEKLGLKAVYQKKREKWIWQLLLVHWSKFSKQLTSLFFHIHHLALLTVTGETLGHDTS